ADAGRGDRPVRSGGGAAREAPVRDGVERRVARILERVRRGGDAALRALTRRFDGARRRRIEVTAAERRAGERQVGRAARAGLRLAAAAEARVDRVFAVGGAQAIAAMAFGTRSVPAVDLIAGPGNRYVAAAKALLAGRVGIDFAAGPSELMVIADRTSDPVRVAADLLGQAEHDPEARLWLVAIGRGVVPRVRRRLRSALA